MYFSLVKPHRNGLECRELCDRPNSKARWVSFLSQTSGEEAIHWIVWVNMQGGSCIAEGRPHLWCCWVLFSTFSQRQGLSRILLVDYSFTRKWLKIFVRERECVADDTYLFIYLRNILAVSLYPLHDSCERFHLLIFWDSLDGKREVEEERQSGAEKLRARGLWSTGPFCLIKAGDNTGSNMSDLLAAWSDQRNATSSHTRFC